MNLLTNLLALDLGSSTGVAWGLDRSETWLLADDKQLRASRKTRMDRRLDIRMSELWANLASLTWAGGKIDWIVFEDVKFGKSLAQVQLWSSFRGIVWAFALANPSIKIDCLPTYALKQFATGSGNADKLAMARALAKRHPDLYEFNMDNGLVKRREDSTLLTDDEVDAIHLWEWASKNIK